MADTTHEDRPDELDGDVHWYDLPDDEVEDELAEDAGEDDMSVTEVRASGVKAWHERVSVWMRGLAAVSR